MIIFFVWMNAQNMNFFSAAKSKKNIVWMVEVAPARQMKKKVKIDHL